MEALRTAAIVPGHGQPADLATGRRDTGDYLDWLVEQLEAPEEIARAVTGLIPIMRPIRSGC